MRTDPNLEAVARSAAGDAISREIEPVAFSATEVKSISPFGPGNVVRVEVRRQDETHLVEVELKYGIPIHGASGQWIVRRVEILH